MLVLGESKVIQSTVEQHGFDLHGSTYTKIFPIDLYNSNPHCTRVNGQVGICVRRGLVQVIRGFLAGAPPPSMLFKGQLYLNLKLVVIPL